MTKPFGSTWTSNKSYQFEITQWEKSSYIVETGGTFLVTGKIGYSGDMDVATTYLIIRLANPYNHDDIIFDTDRDMSFPERSVLRIVDIPKDCEMEFCVEIPIREDLSAGTLDIQLELWSPRRLSWESGVTDGIALFYRTPWEGCVDVIKSEHLQAKVFISYSWDSDEHMKWVSALAQELARRQIKAIIDQNREELNFGGLLTEFMEVSVKEPICLVICSSRYVEKVEDKSKMSGAKYEWNMITHQIMAGRNRATIIPIIRNNSANKLPSALASAKYVDMDTADWKGKPMTELASAIKLLSKKVTPL